jgi:diguanylate cyclase (GGDEF)-like protein/PAS domain S-box-containing protein
MTRAGPDAASMTAGLAAPMPPAAAVPSARIVRDAKAVMTSVDAAIVDVLGWRPEQLIGHPSTEFIHPEDQPSAITAWFAMLAAPGEARVWRGRYQAADGTWRWIESVNLNRLDDADDPTVLTTLTPVGVDQVSVEEELRARKELLSRLSDALPVGLFQIDGEGHITFTNDRLQAIVGCSAAATIEAQFATVVAADRAILDGVVSAALADEPMADVDIRLEPPGVTGAAVVERVCVLGMRPLTDSAGKVSGAIGYVSDVTDRVQLRRELEIRASVDGLTGCLNRAATLELLTDTLARQPYEGGPTAVLYIDLNRFKQVNDSYGHAAGDQLLQVAARRLSRAVRVGDQVGRVGGDEFLVVCPRVADVQQANDIGRRAEQALVADIRVAGHRIKLRASVGVAWTGVPLSADALVAQADAAMYHAKQVCRVGDGSPAA